MTDILRLGDLDLPPDMVWKDRYAHTPVRRAKNTSLAGDVSVFEAPDRARPITLEAGEDHGWLSDAQAATLDAMNSMTGVVWPLLIAGLRFRVILADVSLSELVPVGAAFDAERVWIGTVSLTVVD